MLIVHYLPRTFDDIIFDKTNHLNSILLSCFMND